MAKRKKEKRAVPASGSASVRYRRPLLFAVGAGAIAAVLALAVVAILVFSGGDGSGSAEDGDKTAVIVDQLQLTQPGPQFVSDARATLSEAGYTVEYIAGDSVTVDTYRTLASRGYDLIILRVHAGLTVERDAQTGQTTGTEYVSLFTNESYDQYKYPDELNRLGKASYPDGSGGFFGIGPKFIDDIPGDFNGATVILMGCDGLKSQVTAQAFLDQGADSFISWSDQVSGGHTDKATSTLLKYLLLEGMPVDDAVRRTASEEGPDPTYKGELRVLKP